MVRTVRTHRKRHRTRELKAYFDTLLRSFGRQHWWPARTRLEVVLGAILTQNTAWRNVELAIRQLRRVGLLHIDRLRCVSPMDLERHIRPAGFYRQKARAIRAFLEWLDRHCEGSLAKLFALPPAAARNQMLQLKGLGPETVDAILLYAGHRPFFVADAYTRRILARHGLISLNATYSHAQQFLHTHLPPDTAMFNEFHALLVEAGKQFCLRNTPRCDACPLQRFLPSGRPRMPRRERRLTGRKADGVS